jgi:predicted RNA binding protein YcfA (HicA-like mRNA interferase family)
LSKLPVISGREIVGVLTKIGFAVLGRKGSHVRLKRRGIDSHSANAS